MYLYAGDQIVENVTTGYLYFQDSLGNTSHVTDAAGNLKESYTYDAFGTPTFYNATPDHTQSAPTLKIKHLFQGQLWTQETGLNDYRNRVELPTMGVFLQPDPVGLQFEGEKLSARSAAYFWASKAPEKFTTTELNLYRYCGNDPVDRSDPLGLYGRGFGWSENQWKDFLKKQDLAIQEVSNRLKNMTKQNFEKQFGKDTATKENMARKAGELRAMLTALKDDGKQGYYANAATSDFMKSAAGNNANGLTYPSDRKSIYINVELDFGSQVLKHEAAHNAGLQDPLLHGHKAYLKGTPAERLTFFGLASTHPELALINADTLADYAQ